MRARCLVLDVIGDKGVYEAVISDLNGFYKNLRCDCFDIVRRKIGGKYFDIFCDDLGLFKDSPIPSAVDGNMQPMLVGNLVFANHDSSGETTSLSDEDIRRIKDNIIGIYNVDDDSNWDVVVADY